MSGLPFPSAGDLPNPGIDLGSSELQADSLPAELPGKPSICVIYINIFIYCIIYINTVDLFNVSKMFNDSKKLGIENTHTYTHTRRERGRALSWPRFFPSLGCHPCFWALPSHPLVDSIVCLLHLWGPYSWVVVSAMYHVHVSHQK